MFDAQDRPEGSKAEIYAELASQLRGLLEGERDPIANAANMAALIAWGALVMRAFVQAHWADATAALLGSFALNWYFGWRGPRPTWPGLSMLFAVVGLGLAAYSFLHD